jgi:hypothetical protein
MPVPPEIILLETRDSTAPSGDGRPWTLGGQTRFLEGFYAGGFEFEPSSLHEAVWL